MHKQFVWILLLTTSISFGQTRSFGHKDFDKIEVEDAVKVEIERADEFEVVAEGPEKLLDLYDIEQDGNTLSIGYKSWKSHREEIPVVRVKLPVLKEIRASGATNVKLIDAVYPKLFVKISGASTLYADLDVPVLEINGSGACSIGMSGRAQKVDLKLSGASSFKGKGMLISDELVLNLSGASNAHCQVYGDMVLNISGASNFKYHGDGQILRQDVKEASSVQKVD